MVALQLSLSLTPSTSKLTLLYRHQSRGQRLGFVHKVDQYGFAVDHYDDPQFDPLEMLLCSYDHQLHKAQCERRIVQIKYDEALAQVEATRQLLKRITTQLAHLP